MNSTKNGQQLWVADGFDSSYMESDYPLIRDIDDNYIDACAEYAELIEPPKATDDNGTV